MKNIVYLVETQPSEWDFFRERLADFSVGCVDELREVEADAEVVSVFIHSKIDAEFLDAHPRAKLITTRSAGYDHIDVAECAPRGVTVCNVSSVDENTVAEHTFALMLAVARRLLEMQEANKQPHFRYEMLRGFDLRGKTLGVVGTGRVGLRVIHIALAFGMKVLAHDPYNRSLMAELLGVHYFAFDALLRRSHVISLHTPLTAETHGLIDREAFAKMRPGAIIINTARGGLIETEALIEALDAEIATAGNPDFLFFGHTHWPVKIRCGKTLVVNPGSVGQPKDGDPRAACAVWQDGEVSLRRAAYDVEETVRAYENTMFDSADIAALAEVLRTGGNLPARIAVGGAR